MRENCRRLCGFCKQTREQSCTGMVFFFTLWASYSMIDLMVAELCSLYISSQFWSSWCLMWTRVKSAKHIIFHVASSTASPVTTSTSESRTQRGMPLRTPSLNHSGIDDFPVIEWWFFFPTALCTYLIFPFIGFKKWERKSIFLRWDRHRTHSVFHVLLASTGILYRLQLEADDPWYLEGWGSAVFY